MAACCASAGDAYYDAGGITQNQANGVRYKGSDSPQSGAGDMKGEWKFRLSAIDTCNDNKQIGEYDYVTVDWNP